MSAHFTIGIEEEFQTVDRSTGQLCGRIQQILERGCPIFGEQIKAEALQPTVELNSSILPDIPTARHELRMTRAKLAQLLAGEGLALISAGTHPSGRWQDQMRSLYKRYQELETASPLTCVPSRRASATACSSITTHLFEQSVQRRLVNSLQLRQGRILLRAHLAVDPLCL
jgi:hypothetical protein